MNDNMLPPFDRDGTVDMARERMIDAVNNWLLPFYILLMFMEDGE